MATPISQENTAAAERRKHRSSFVMTLLRQARQSDQLSEYPGTLKHVGPSSLPHGVRATVWSQTCTRVPPGGHYTPGLTSFHPNQPSSCNSVPLGISSTPFRLCWETQLTITRLSVQPEWVAGVLLSPSFAPKQMKPIHNDLCFLTGQTED